MSVLSNGLINKDGIGGIFQINTFQTKLHLIHNEEQHKEVILFLTHFGKRKQEIIQAEENMLSIMSFILVLYNSLTKGRGLQSYTIRKLLDRTFADDTLLYFYKSLKTHISFFDSSLATKVVFFYQVSVATIDNTVMSVVNKILGVYIV